MKEELNKIIHIVNNSPSDLSFHEMNFLIDALETMQQKLQTIKKITNSYDNNASTEKYTITTIKEILQDFA
jgi:tRNA A37 threonylcarbamoyladenosine dehydratase